MRVDRVAMLDWSSARGPKRGKDSIWLGQAGAGARAPLNLATRSEAEAALHAVCAEAGRVLIGVDIGFAWPAGFAEGLTGQARALAVWDWLAARITDGPEGPNHRAVAAQANARFAGGGPFWGDGSKDATPGLPRLKPDLPPGMDWHRGIEKAAAFGRVKPKSMFQLAGVGAVGVQALTCIPVLQRLRLAYPGEVAVWPFEPVHGARVVLAEVYFSLLAPLMPSALPRYACLDAAQVDLLARAVQRLSDAGALSELMRPAAPSAQVQDEGWILGAGHHGTLQDAAVALQPPRLSNDCFALPQGVDWVPVDTALERLRAAMVPLTEVESVPVAQALGRVLADPAVARRSNPPAANSAVDGYGFAHAAIGAGPQRLALLEGRAAAGQPFPAAVPHGAAVRILTGAILPDGVDTVVLEEDCATDGVFVAFQGGLKPRANTRKAGEDLPAGAVALPAGKRLRAPDLALLAALGLAAVRVRRRLRVGVLSTGDEIVTDPASDVALHQIHDANRPMLLALARGWDYEAVDLGHAPDNEGAIRAALDRGAAQADVILTSGGASAGDEDHVSRLLRVEGALQSWRIAIKPGRPLALALWRGVPVFGLPGNPVAAFTCALVFAQPALSALAGAGWTGRQGFVVPAAFSKRKKAGRREFLRARLDPGGAAEVFASEGSGRISGLTWATGFVELPDEAVTINPGDPVLFLPYAGFGVV